MSDPTNNPFGSSGYGGNDYEPNGYGTNNLGAGDSAYQRDTFSDGYAENPYAVNFFDTPYTETIANPNPEPPSSFDWER